MFAINRNNKLQQLQKLQVTFGNINLECIIKLAINESIFSQFDMSLNLLFVK